MVEFVEIKPEQIIKEIVADYEAATGKTLYPGQAEYLILNSWAYRESLLLSKINDASNQNLLAFSRAPFLDLLGDLVGVKRSAAKSAVCSIKFTLINGHGPLVIPAGLRLQSIDGNIIFTLDSDINVLETDVNVYGAATCTEEGAAGNNIPAGSLNAILDPQPYLVAAENINETAGGASVETDDALRERIRLAPSAFSTAGSEGAYIFHAKTANPGISEVSITSPNPGDVYVYPLMANGELPNSNVLQQVRDALSPQTIRPLNDTVVVLSPSEVNYDINVELTLLTGSVPSENIEIVRNELIKYSNERKQKCGLDIVLSKITQLSKQFSNVYDVNIIEPTVNVQVAKNEVAKVGTITVTVGGYSDE